MSDLTYPLASRFKFSALGARGYKGVSVPLYDFMKSWEDFGYYLALARLIRLELDGKL